MSVTEVEVTTDELTRRRNEVLARLSITVDELKDRHSLGVLTPEEWAAWDELERIEFLLG